MSPLEPFSHTSPIGNRTTGTHSSHLRHAAASPEERTLVLEPNSWRFFPREVRGAIQWLLLLASTVCVGFGASRVRLATPLVADFSEQAREWWQDLAADRGLLLIERELSAAGAALTSERGDRSQVKAGAVMESRSDFASVPLEPAPIVTPIVEAPDVTTQAQGPDLPPIMEAPALAPEPNGIACDCGACEREESVEAEPEAPDTAAQERRLKALVQEGRARLRNHDLQAAERIFRHVLALRPSHLGALSGLARTLLGRGELDRAREIAQIAVHMTPYQPAYHVLLGDVLRVAGDPEQAEFEYRRATELNRSKPVDRVARALPPNPF